MIQAQQHQQVIQAQQHQQIVQAQQHQRTMSNMGKKGMLEIPKRRMKTPTQNARRRLDLPNT
jgi:hypothetical protein